jgi:hypothetical protein
MRKIYQTFQAENIRWYGRGTGRLASEITACKCEPLQGNCEEGKRKYKKSRHFSHSFGLSFFYEVFHFLPYSFLYPFFFSLSSIVSFKFNVCTYFSSLILYHHSYLLPFLCVVSSCLQLVLIFYTSRCDWDVEILLVRAQLQLNFSRRSNATTELNSIHFVVHIKAAIPLRIEKFVLMIPL